MIIIVKINNDM